MRVIAKRTLRTFWQQHPGARAALQAWHAEMSAAEFASPNELKAYYPSASIVGDGRVVFNIKGNRFRLIVRIAYRPRPQLCYIRFVGTHAEYDKIDATTI